MQYVTFLVVTKEPKAISAAKVDVALKNKRSPAKIVLCVLTRNLYYDYTAIKGFEKQYCLTIDMPML